MFGSSVGDVMNQEAILFSKFKYATFISEEWVKAFWNTKQDTEDAQRSLERRYLSWTADENDHRSAVTSEPKFVEDILNIRTETALLEEVKDIQDELGILLQVIDDQQGVHKELCSTFG
jgi:hypothetical protein